MVPTGQRVSRVRATKTQSEVSLSGKLFQELYQLKSLPTCCHCEIPVGHVGYRDLVMVIGKCGFETMPVASFEPRHFKLYHCEHAATAPAATTNINILRA